MRIPLALAALIATQALGETVALKVGAIVDPVTGTDARDQTVIVDNGIIRAVGHGLAIPNSTRVIDLSTDWLAPGLMDAHQHLSLGMVYEARQPYPDLAVYLTESTAHRALRGLHNAQLMLHAGFTTIRDPGYEGEYAMVDVRRAVAEGIFDGPTIISGGKVIAPFGGNSGHISPERGRFWDYEYIDADTPDEVRRAVRRNLYYGATVIKLLAQADPGADQPSYHYSVEEIRAAVDEAHKAGVAVAIHVMGGAAAQAAIDGGVDSIEHGWSLSDTQLSQMKAKGIFLCGTDIPRDQLAAWLGEQDAAQSAIEILDRLKRANKIGVRMAFGTDIWYELPGRSRADLALGFLSVWQSAGIEPAAILRAMTSDAAELLRVNHERGRIAPGLAADMIAMPADPLRDIEALRKIDFVMKNGKTIRAP
jgi:imidazolonepropionase-like amidohydrolase